MSQASCNGNSLPHTAPATILVVEDEPLIRFTVADYLRDCGYHVVEAADVQEAMALLEAPEPAIDLVFSDVHMPGERNGFDLARWARDSFPGLPVILTSGLAQTAELGEELCALGPIEAKPYNHRSLEERIRRMIATAGPRVMRDPVMPLIAEPIPVSRS